MNAYHIGVNRPLGEMMPSGYTSAVLDYTSVMNPGEKQQSNQKYYILLLLYRQQPMTEVLNNGDGLEKTGGCPRTCGDIESRDSYSAC